MTATATAEIQSGNAAPVATEQDLHVLLDILAKMSDGQWKEVQLLRANQKAEAERLAAVEAAQRLTDNKQRLLDFVADELQTDMDTLGWVGVEYAAKLKEEVEELKARLAKRQAKESRTPSAKTSNKHHVEKGDDARDKGDGVYLTDDEVEEQEVLKVKQRGKLLVLKADPTVTFKTGRANSKGCFPDGTIDRRKWKAK